MLIPKVRDERGRYIVAPRSSALAAKLNRDLELGQQMADLADRLGLRPGDLGLVEIRPGQYFVTFASFRIMEALGAVLERPCAPAA